MSTMLVYANDSCLWVHEDINPDLDKHQSFWVINGHWGGKYKGGWISAGQGLRKRVRVFRNLDYSSYNDDEYNEAIEQFKQEYLNG